MSFKESGAGLPEGYVYLKTKTLTWLYTDWIFDQEFNICTLTSIAKYFNRDVNTITKKLKSLLVDAKSVQELQFLKKQIEDHFKLSSIQA